MAPSTSHCHRPPSASASSRACIWLLALACAAGPTTLLPRTAPAQTRKQVADAEEITRQAVARFKAKEHDAAAELFMRAYELARNPTSVFNAARAKEAGGKPSEAKALYELYLRIAGSPAGVADAQRRIDAIDAAVAEEAARKAEADRQAAAAAEAERVRALQARRDAEAVAAAQTARAQAAEAEAQRAREATRAAEERTQPGRGSTGALAVLPPPDVVTSRLGDGGDSAALQRLTAGAVAEAALAGLGPVRGPAELQAAMAGGAAQRGTAVCEERCQLTVAAQLRCAWAIGTTAGRDGAGVKVAVSLWRVSGDGLGVEVARADALGPTVAAAVAALAPWRLQAIFDPARRFALTAVAHPLPATPDLSLLRLDATPAGAAVSVDERPVGSAPIDLRLTAGVHRLRISARGYADRSGAVDLAGGQSFALHVDLTALGGPAKGAPAAAQAPPATPSSVAPPGVGTSGRPHVIGGAASGSNGPSGGAAPDGRAAGGGPAAGAGGGAATGSGTGSPGAGPGSGAQVRPTEQPAQAGPPPARPTGGTVTEAEPPAGSARPAGAPGEAPRRDMPPRWPPGAVGPGAGGSNVARTEVPFGFYLRAGGAAAQVGKSGFATEGHVGLMGHVGVGRPGALPWIALTFGVDRHYEFGASPGRSPWRATDIFGGIALPQLSGTMVALHRRSYDNTEGVGAFKATSLSVRKLLGGQRAFIAFGIDVPLASTRESVDDAFGPGMIWRVFLEVGVGGFGNGLVN